MAKHFDIGSPEHNEDLKRRAEKRFETIDNLPPDVREVIHEYGWAGVKELMALGVKSGPRLKHIIRCCRGER